MAQLHRCLVHWAGFNSSFVCDSGLQFRLHGALNVSADTTTSYNLHLWGGGGGGASDSYVLICLEVYIIWA